MKDELAIKTIVQLLAKAKGWSPSYASMMVSGSGDTLTRIDKGMSPTSRRIRKIMQKCSDHWPVDLEWPDGIMRPAPKGKDAA